MKLFRICLLLLHVGIESTRSEIERSRDELCNASNAGKLWLSKTYSKMMEVGPMMDHNVGSPLDVPRENFHVPKEISWTTRIPNLPIVFATSPTIPDGRCKKQVQMYLNDLANSTLWAVQMFDASSKYPDGIIYGHTKHLGNFDQCYDIRAPLRSDESDPESEDEVEGRYCLVRLRYQHQRLSANSNKPRHLSFDPNAEAWEAINDNGDFRRVRRHSIYMALCVPAACSATDVAAAIAAPLAKMGDARGLSVETTVEPTYCQARRDSPANLTVGAKIFCIVLGALVALTLFSSWYDSSLYSVEEAADDVGSEDFFLCFSMRRNMRSIFGKTTSQPGLDCIHLIRSFMMVLVIFGHRMMQYYGYPMENSVTLETMYLHPIFMIIFNGTIIIDAFFGLGGLLLAYGILEELDRSKRLNFTAIVLIRFFRLTPLYILVVTFHATLLPQLGSGPFWDVKIGRDQKHCSTNWWANFLYINNYVKTREMCMFQSWYLSADFQLYAMGALVLWAFWKMPRRLGYPFLTLLLIAGLAINFFVTYIGNLQPMFRGLPFMQDPRRDPYFQKYYIASHMRIAPYMVGILSGAVVYDYKGATWKLPKAWSRFLILFTIGLTMSSPLAAKYYDPNYNYQLHPIETALYATLHRAAYALGVCAIIVLITIGDGLESYHSFFTPQWAPPLARLTYGAFLLHNLNQSYEIGVTRAPRTFSMHNLFWDLVPDIIYTFGISLLCSTIVEVPLRKIEKRMLPRRSSKKSPDRAPSNEVKKND